MDIDLQLFKNIMAEARHNNDLLDSFSPNQFLSKEKIIKLIRDQLILRTDSEIVIFGGWYGSILIPAFKEVKRITLIDKDKDVISIAKNRLFNHYKNVDFICDDVFNWAPDSSRIKNTDLIINTSCEHMSPVDIKKSIVAFQSNDYFSVDDHVNCVNNVEELINRYDFKEIYYKGELDFNRYKRFMVIGKLS